MFIKYNSGCKLRTNLSVCSRVFLTGVTYLKFKVDFKKIVIEIIEKRRLLTGARSQGAVFKTALTGHNPRAREGREAPEEESPTNNLTVDKEWTTN